MKASGTAKSLPAVLVVLNALLCCAVLAAREPLPQSYFDSRDARVERTATGFSFHLITDVDPLLILAERPLVYPMGNRDVVGGLALLINLPSVIVSMLL